LELLGVIVLVGVTVFVGVLVGVVVLVGVIVGVGVGVGVRKIQEFQYPFAVNQVDASFPDENVCGVPYSFATY